MCFRFSWPVWDCRCIILYLHCTCFTTKTVGWNVHWLTDFVLILSWCRSLILPNWWKPISAWLWKNVTAHLDQWVVMEVKAAAGEVGESVLFGPRCWNITTNHVFSKNGDLHLFQENLSKLIIIKCLHIAILNVCLWTSIHELFFYL